MALDGFVVSCIVNELSTLLIGGRIDKVSQPEKDEIILSIRNNRSTYKLLLCAQANFPRIHLTEVQKINPMTAMSFCMILRKYLNNAKITGIRQPDLERIVELEFEHMNELGDLCNKKLIIEIMGRHSNIILCDEELIVLDSIKHVSHQISSVREVLPGKQYFYPPAGNKLSILEVSDFTQFQKVLDKPIPLFQAIYEAFIGFSPLLAEEICYIAKIDSRYSAHDLDPKDYKELYAIINVLVSRVIHNDFHPAIFINEQGDFIDFHVLSLTLFDQTKILYYDIISKLLDDYFEKRSNVSRINQKSVEIRKIVQNNLERCAKKIELYERQIKDTKKRESFKIKGELIQANLYQIEEGLESVELYNYYTQKYEKISLDKDLTPIQNAQKYYAKYNKKKRTFIALTDQIEIAKKELDHLESIKYALDIAKKDMDLTEIKNELMESGYMKAKRAKGKNPATKSEPLHYISSDGFHIYVGKNNLQNDELSLKFASNSDWWFHVQALPGSHVIVKTEGREMTDKAFEEAAEIAAYYSKAQGSNKVVVDYTLKKNLKKPNGSKPGFVIYHTYYSMVVDPSKANFPSLK